MRPLLRSQRGFTYIAALVMVMILGIVLGTSAQFWTTRMKRERETELLFRGMQYRDAIRRWYKWDPRKPTGGQAHPLNDLKDLLKDPNSTTNVRYLRQLYKDPMTGDDFDVIKRPPLGIVGVKSKSGDEPLKQGGFPDDPVTGLNQQDFEQKKKYSEWEFIFDRKPTFGVTGSQTGLQTSTPGSPNPGGTPSTTPSGTIPSGTRIYTPGSQ